MCPEQNGTHVSERRQSLTYEIRNALQAPCARVKAMVINRDSPLHLFPRAQNRGHQLPHGAAHMHSIKPQCRFATGLSFVGSSSVASSRL